MLVSTLLLCSCKDTFKDADSFEEVLEQSTGQGHTSIKYSYDHDGDYHVFKNEVTGEFTAYNLRDFDRKKMNTMEAYLRIADSNDIVPNLEPKVEWVEDGYYREESRTYTTCDSDGQNCNNYTETWKTNEWVDLSRNETFYYGGGFRFDNTSTASRDLETLAALSETMAVTMISSTLSSAYSLSATRAEELAKLTYRYKKMESARELTAPEKDAFALSALGVSLTQVESTLKERAKGNELTYQALLQKAASVNRTTPEQIGKFFDEYLTEL